MATAVHPIVGLGKQIVINDLQLRHIFRLGGFGDDVAGVSLVPDQAADIDRLELGTLPGAEAALIEHPGHRVAAGTLVGDLFKYLPHPDGFLRVDLQILDRLVAFVDAALVYRTIPVWHEATGIVPARDDLADAVAGAHGCFFALPCRLPEADVVHQLVTVALDPLLALVGAPHFNAVLDKPFQHKRRLTLDPPQPVEHIDQQDVKLPVAGCCA